MTDSIDMLAAIKRREMILAERNKLARRAKAKGYGLAAVCALLALMCGAVLYVKIFPKEPVYGYEMRQELTHLINSLF